MGKIFFLKAEKEHANIRLDKALLQLFPDYSRHYLQNLIVEGHVSINGIQPKKRLLLKEGDLIQVDFISKQRPAAIAEKIPLEILFEDEHLLAINKPPCLVVHPAPGHPTGTVVNALIYHQKVEKKDEEDLRPGIVHRLDKDTSGLLLVAKNPIIHAKLTSLFSERKIQKTYIGICVGTPGTTTINQALKRHAKNRKEFTISQDSKAKSAITHCRTLKKGKELSLVEWDLITGRTHQIRVHMKFLGCPILGDSVYGRPSINQKYEVKRQMLHAYKLSFEHPITQETLKLEAPLFEDMLLVTKTHFENTY